MPGSSRDESEPLGKLLEVRAPRQLAIVFELTIRFLLFALLTAPILSLLGTILLDYLDIKQSLSNGIVLGLVFVACNLLIVRLVHRRRWNQLGARIYIYPERLVHTRGSRVVHYRWEELEAFYCWGAVRAPSLRILATPYHYRVVRQDGRHFDFSETLLGTDGEPLAYFVEKGLRECRLPSLQKRFLQDQESIAFGPLTLEEEGLRRGPSLLPWNRMDDVIVAGGRIAVKERDNTVPWCSVKMRKVPNVCLFLALTRIARAALSPASTSSNLH